MIEIPESKNLARQLTQALSGKVIWSVAAAASPHGFAGYHGDPAEYPARLTGCQIDRADGFGGMVEIVAGDMRILFNDGINLRYLEAGTPPPKKHQLLLVFGDGSALVCSVSMYGGMMAFKQGEEENGYITGSRTKVSPLADGFNRAYFELLREATSEKLSAKAFLATEQRVPGLGNGVLQDILFNARINPMKKLSALVGADIDKLYDAVKTTLRDMTELGGRDTERDIFGNPCGYKTILSRNTLDQPCPVCGGAITKKAYMGGSVYYCGACQPM